MHLISIARLRADSFRFSNIDCQIQDWYDTVRKANWQNLEEVRAVFRDAEAVGNFTVFNIKGNAYRLIVGIDYEDSTIYYKYLLSHQEYDRDRWKNDPYF